MNSKPLRVDRDALSVRLRDMGMEDSEESFLFGEIYVMLTLACNLRCDFCVWRGRSGPCRKKAFSSKYRPGLSMTELRRFADQAAEFFPRVVTLSGGEPLLHRSWYPLAKYLRQKGIKVAVTTNGTLIEENIDKLTEATDQVNVSLDSCFSARRDYGGLLFARVLRGLERLAKAGGCVELHVLWTISALNLPHINGIIDILRARGIKVARYDFQHLMFVDEKTLKRQRRVFSEHFHIRQLYAWGGYLQPSCPIDPDQLFKQINALRPLGNVFFSPELNKREDLAGYYRHNRGAPHYRRFCTAPWHQVNLLPNGDITVCPDYLLGNIKRDPLKVIWNGRKAKVLRRFLTKSLFPACKGCFYFYTDRRP